MKTLPILSILVSIVLARAGASSASAQGTITFNNPWIENGIGYFGLGYIDGISFRVSDPSQLGASMAHIGASLAGHPSNGTPHLEPSSTLAPSYVIFAFTNAASSGRSFTNGAAFGLISVDLADSVAPSLSPILITFNGYRADNTLVSQAFTVGGGGSAAFQTFLFNSSFASGLTRVEMPSSAWAMDNLVFIPEPGSATLVLLGLVPLALRKRRAR